jgi:hypothetical protein
MRRTIHQLFTLFLFGLSAAISGYGQTGELRDLNASVEWAMKKTPFDYAAYSSAIEKARQAVYRMIDADQIKTADDFYLASQLADDPTGFYESRRVQHELALAGMVLGHPNAVKRVSMTWDGLNWSLGRGQRIGTFKRDGVVNNMDPVPMPAVLKPVFTDTDAAKARAASAKTNDELENIRQADQKDREGQPNVEMVQRINKNDPARRARVLEMIASGMLTTGRDLHNASVVLQHGHDFEDFRLAHELAIGAVALGDREAVWLISRTYDRMLLTLGHRQRLNTQSRGETGQLMPWDPTSVNERIRKLLGSK